MLPLRSSSWWEDSFERQSLSCATGLQSVLSLAAHDWWLIWVSEQHTSEIEREPLSQQIFREIFEHQTLYPCHNMPWCCQCFWIIAILISSSSSNSSVLCVSSFLRSHCPSFKHYCFTVFFPEFVKSLNIWFGAAKNSILSSVIFDFSPRWNYHTVFQHGRIIYSEYQLPLLTIWITSNCATNSFGFVFNYLMFVRSLVLQLLLALCPNSTSFSVQSFHVALIDRSSTFVAFGFVCPVGALDVCWQQILVVAFQLSLNQVRMCGPVPPCFQPAPTYTHQDLQTAANLLDLLIKKMWPQACSPPKWLRIIKTTGCIAVFLKRVCECDRCHERLLCVASWEFRAKDGALSASQLFLMILPA